MTEMNFPEVAPPAPAKKTNWKVIIPVAIVIILCCLCIAVVGVLAYMGTQGSGPFASLLATADPTGDWNVYFSWDCTGSYSSGYMTFYNDHTFNVNNDSSLWGTWKISGSSVDFEFNEWPNSHYIGTISGEHMEGTMDNLDDMTGCWYADR